MRSLWVKLVSAFAGVILLGVIVNSLLINQLTQSQFSQYVTATGQAGQRAWRLPWPVIMRNMAAGRVWNSTWAVPVRA